MDVGIGLPSSIPGVSGTTIIEWAQRAEAARFSSLGTIDRVVYPNFEPLVTLAAVAGVTRRIRLVTGILLAPLRNGGILAKQAASLDALSGGRLTLGLGVGIREDDFRAAPASYEDRGRRFEEQLALMKRAWAGEPISDSDDVGPIGPRPARPGGPEILIGGFRPAAIRRVARWGDGFIGGAAGPEMAQQGYGVAQQAWREAGRPGRPRFVVGNYYALGPNAAERAGEYIRHYYASAGPIADTLANAVPLTPEAVKATIGAFADIGADELVLAPCIPELDQVDRLAEIVG